MATRRNRKVRIFETSIEKLGRILSSKWKVKVVFRHGECKTDGSTIYLPVLPDKEDANLMKAMQGHLDHETAHVVFTDFKEFQKLRRAPKLLTMANALEDTNIERKWIQMWRGAAVNLKYSHEWAYREIVKEKEIEDENGNKMMKRPWDELSDLGKFIQAALCFVENDFDKNHWFLRDVVEDEIFQHVKQCEDLLRTAQKADTTKEIVPIAKEILDLLQEEDPDLPEIDPEDIPDDAIMIPPGAGPSPQQQSMMKKQPSDPNAPPMVQMEYGEGEEGEGEGEGMPGDGQDGSTCDFNPSDEDVKNDEELTSIPNMLKDATTRPMAQNDCYLVYTTEGDEIEKISEGNRQEYKQFMQEANRMVSVMKRKMARSLLSTNISRWEGDKLRGKVNPRAIHRVAMGTSKRVFRQRVEAEAFDTCVAMMVDHSGSMMGHQLDLAAKTAIIFGEILHQLSIPFSVMGFSTGSGGVANKRYNQASVQEQRLYSRWGNLWIGQYKSFKDSWQNSNHRLINMRYNCKMNTYDGESLRYGAQVLLERPEKRKILFWLNDGMPCPNGRDDSYAHRRYAHDAAKEVERLVELFAIGINTTAVKEFYTNCVAIHDVNDIPSTAFRELDELVRKGKTYHGKAA
jgi:cobalamin biosynthesis protein CobT